jgi:hypothetical protein
MASKIARRVARRFLTAAGVKVKVDPEATQKGREQWGFKDMLVGEFASPIKLYRVFDGEELRKIVKGGEITGGGYSIAVERAYGASWGADKNEVVKWGESQRGKRLGHELFMAEVNGQGRPFGHMHITNLDVTEPTLTIPTEACSTGMGCSLRVKASDVDRWYIVENGKATPAKWPELVEQAKAVGLKPRRLELYHGALVKPPRGMANYLHAELARIRVRQIKDRNEKWKAEGRIPRAKRPSGWPASLLRVVCMKETFRCRAWSTSESQAEGDSKMGSSDGRTTFSVMFKIHTVGVAPEHMTTPREDFTLDMILVYDPETRLWEQLFNRTMGTAPELWLDERAVPQPV